MYEPRFARKVDLGAQQTNKNIERITFNAVLESPQRIHDMFALNYDSDPAHQQFEQPILRPRQIDSQATRAPSREDVSSVKSPTRRTTGAEMGARRLSARIRASSTSNENGFVT